MLTGNFLPISGFMALLNLKITDFQGKARRRKNCAKASKFILSKK